MSAVPVETRAEGSEVMNAAIRSDLAHGLFFPVYQPFVNLARGHVQGYEAFVRRSRSGAESRPAAFLPAASGSDLICDLDTWVLRQATTQLADWHRSVGTADLIIAINLADEHVRQARVITDVFSTLAATGIEPDRLLVDVVCDETPTNADALTHLTILRRLGVCVCLDVCVLASGSAKDVARLPVDIVKLHPGCLDAAHAAPERVVRRVEALQDAGLPIVAGGIETAEQLEFARLLGCEWGQGFHLGAPLPADLINVATA